MGDAGEWTDSSNWTGGLPGSGDTAVVDMGLVEIAAPITVASIKTGAGDDRPIL